MIEVTGSTPTATGTTTLDARTARRAPGALLRALALLPGVVTSIAASGYPIIRDTLPGESRFAFDGLIGDLVTMTPATPATPATPDGTRTVQRSPIEIGE